VIYSDERKVKLGMDNRVLIWRRPCEEWTPLCLNPGRSVRVSLMITYEGVGNLTVVDSNINAQKYIVHFNIKSLIILFGPLLHVISQMTIMSL
jgi:hypothetical protein